MLIVEDQRTCGGCWWNTCSPRADAAIMEAADGGARGTVPATARGWC